MKITVDIDKFIGKFLVPIGRVAENCVVVAEPNCLYALVNDSAGSVILYNKIGAVCEIGDKPQVNINIKDVKKFIKVFECIDSDGELVLELDDKASVLKYRSKTMNFKIHLMTDNIIKASVINIKKFQELAYDFDFILTSEDASKIIKGSVFTSEVDRVYIYCKDGSVHADLTLQSSQDVDSMSFLIADKYNGESIPAPIPVNLETLRLIASTRFTAAKVRVNTRMKYLLFDIQNDESELKYLVSAFTK